ncbi:hypothetical protein PHG11b_62 [Flavobacterium phage 11b]|nr:hypothetical protein PHG11b_62 [Flavobacterium phage 11b]CAH56689.1 hypothetical protein PHG11b_62 [Flavobacterium phage 11b]
MKLLKTDCFGIGLGFDYVKLELSIHLFIWCLDVKFYKITEKEDHNGNR